MGREEYAADIGQGVEVFMNYRVRSVLTSLFVLLTTVGPAFSVVPQLTLGEKPAFGLFQPRVSIEIFADRDGQQGFGPESSSFLLDTGATSTLIFPPATTELLVPTTARCPSTACPLCACAPGVQYDEAPGYCRPAENRDSLAAAVASACG